MAQKILDIAHISFLDMINVILGQNGAASAKGVLIRNALNAANMVASTHFDTVEEYLASIPEMSNPIARVEGVSFHVKDGIFGLKSCPFAPSIKDYLEVFNRLPEGFQQITSEFNKPTLISNKLRIGEGAGVSPFCAVHQSIRSALGEKIEIAGRPLKIYQLGCKSSDGRLGLAIRWIEEAGVDQGIVMDILETHMCCYLIEHPGFNA